MRPIIGNSIVVGYIIRVRSIEAVRTMVNSILRHLPVLIACSAEKGKLLSIVGR